MEHYTIRDIAEFGMLLGSFLGGVWYIIKKTIKVPDNFFEEKDCIYPKEMLQDVKIHDMLVELRTETRADRVMIFQFHNGEHYASETSIRKFSCTHEVLKEGVASAITLYRNQLLSCFIEGFRFLIESDSPLTKLSYDTLPNGLYKSTMIDTGSKLHIGLPLKVKRDDKTLIVGLLVIAYNDEQSLDNCAFNALISVGHFIDSGTKQLKTRICDGTCIDCRFAKYVTRLETELFLKGNKPKCKK